MPRLRIGTLSLLKLSVCQTKSQDQPICKEQKNSSHPLIGRGARDVDPGKGKVSGAFLAIYLFEVSLEIKTLVICWELQRNRYQIIFRKNLIIVEIMSSLFLLRSDSILHTYMWKWLTHYLEDLIRSYWLCLWIGKFHSLGYMNLEFERWIKIYYMWVKGSRVWIWEVNLRKFYVKYRKITWYTL